MTTEASSPIDPEPKEKKTNHSVSPGSFATVVSAMNRFLGKLTDSGLFQDGDLGLTEWSFLSELANEPRPSKKLGNDLGIVKPRMRQLVERMKSIGCITVKGEARELALTDEGTRRIGVINDRIAPILARAQHKKGAFQKTSKCLRSLTRLIGEPKSPERKARKKNKKKSNDDDSTAF